MDVIARLRAAGCVFAEDEARLLTDAATTSAELDVLVARRVEGIPLEHLLGWAEFRGARMAVAPGVFVPRRRTEFLAEQAIALTRPGQIVVDLCCGCGAVGASIAAEIDVEVHAADIEPAAVACARRNLPDGHVHQGDLYAALPPSLRGRVDVLVSNVPYVPTDRIAMMPPEARAHEPHSALDGGPDGLDFQRRVAAEAPDWLAPGGHLLVETSVEQSPESLSIFETAGLTARLQRCADREATIVLGRHDRG
ncbi:putative protein N(5)-glutamine methyltransferase [Actinokineospora enzanensis]|uniref:putative protein N(5)-glutamine methyltransferase n=1 Tax=Actinokineospora enzanensis TaxID=155975 RepID=UPI0003A9B337|nr:putative protein N(5)-glutamine methyltransferase [Actinokineospora enzanensis]